MQNQSKLILHHVGGRAGSISFPISDNFEQDIINIIYDADKVCVKQIESLWHNKECQTYVYPYCLLDKIGNSSFNLNYDPYTSSIYSFDEKFKEYYSPNDHVDIDYVFGDAFRTMNKFDLNTTTLDEIVEKDNIIPPDFLSIDTQGSELNILMGAKKCLEQNILSLLVEVEFLPIYKNQPLFGDICKFLYKYGFLLSDLSYFRRYPCRGKEWFRGAGDIVDGEALFIKSPNALKNKSDKEKALQLNKLSFISLIFNRFETLQLCVQNKKYKVIASDEKYLRLVGDLASLVKELPDRSLPIFSDKYTFEQSKNRFQIKPKDNKHRNSDSYIFIHLKNRLKNNIYFRLIIKFYQRIKQLLSKCSTNIYFYYKGLFKKSKVEQLLLQYGLKEQCLLVMRNRIFDMNKRRMHFKNGRRKEFS